MRKPILLLGEYDVGKSHFGGQLLGRLREAKGALRMTSAPATLAPFDGVLVRLNQGKAAGHTGAANYRESFWQVADAEGRTMDLVWPDYGGEQVTSLRNDRRMSPDWRKRVETSTGWVVMIRIHNSHVPDDIFSRPLHSIGERPAAPKGFVMSDQAKLVDFLQWLAFVRGTGTLERITEPRLILLLSCWDELPQDEIGNRPWDVLRLRMPMVAAYLEANWEPGALHVLGLSALERALSEDTVDEEYVDRGPESFGYMVQPDGTRDKDLTLAITPLLRA
ncbi:hypothetical protein ASG47_07040 [Devosia sp. Leaf420]|uniref:TRAFAC clade GTPase domain-containing protein n=1 Tax=Devosia sp. Leaf420 TaxID=1736374 RepID=UPI000712A740|nr:hypothetical protein [Devosia sp. Leaf420]KQT48124.1 hypothetical protein ASG47_07040 [Devosia sp. Leaf420]